MSYFTEIKNSDTTILIDKKVLEKLEQDNWLNKIEEDYDGDIYVFLTENTDYEMRTFLNLFTMEKLKIIYWYNDNYYRVSVNKNYEDSLIEIIEDENLNTYILQSIDGENKME